MTLVIETAAIANPTSFLGLNPAVPDGILAFYMPGRSAASTQADQSGTGNGGTVTGLPTYDAGFAKFDGGAGAFMTSGISDRTSMTVMVVCKSAETFDGSTAAPIFSTHLGTSTLDAGHNSNGVSLIFEDSGDDLRLVTARWDGAAVSSATAALQNANAPDPSQWGLYCARWSNTIVQLDDLTNDRNASVVATVPYDPTDNNIIIGARPNINSANEGENDISELGMWGRLLSDYERDLMAVQMRALAANYGITV